MDTFPSELFTAVGGWALILLNTIIKGLDDKNNSNEIILIGSFLKVKEDFSFLDVQKGVLHT